MTATTRYRVRGALAESALAEAKSGTTFVRTAFDLRSRAVLEVVARSFVVRYEGFKKTTWAWRESAEAHREYDDEEADIACRYFNSLLLSPGYLGASRIDQAAEGE